MPVGKINPPLGSNDPNNEVKIRIRLIRQLEKLIKEEMGDCILNHETNPEMVIGSMEKVIYMQGVIKEKIKELKRLTGGDYFHYNDNEKYVDEEPCHVAPENVNGGSINLATATSG